MIYDLEFVIEKLPVRIQKMLQKICTTQNKIQNKTQNKIQIIKKL